VIFMALKNYYVILGVERAQGTAAIRAAFRDLARRYHPDHAGPASTRAFREIQEAYQVLSDPDARREYDRRLPPRAEAMPGEPPIQQPPASADEAEPLIPETMSLARDFYVRPSREAMLDRFLRNFAEPRRPKGEQVRSMNVEVVLTSEQARRGGLVAIGVPAFVTCPSCRGTGRVWLYRCEYCWGEGLIETERPVRVQVPPLVADHTVVEIPLGGLGIRNFYLRVILRVGG
jgi:molecular chaperone DnaJ